jgi:ABC-type phosphate/phosphonate transport system substrate-binding protein
MDFLINDAIGKLGKGFTSADELKAINIRPSNRPRPTYISANLDPEFEQELVALLKEFRDCFAWEYNEMPGLD